MTPATAFPGFPPATADRPWRQRFFLRGWRLPVMIAGFIAWWPIGLFLLALFGALHAMPCSARFALRSRLRDRMPAALAGTSGNSAFDEHRASVLRRLEEERRALDAQQAEFAAFMDQLRRARDREEFERFMQARDARV